MSYDIEVSRIAFKNMAKIPRKELVRIQEKIDSLTESPQPSDMKKIQGDANLYCVRAGNYRILYRIFDEKICILIVDVDHRKDIYKKM